MRRGGHSSCSEQDLVVALITVCAVIVPADPACFETPTDKNVGKRDILWDQQTHTHSLGKCGCSRITLDELGESEMTPN